MRISVVPGKLVYPGPGGSEVGEAHQFIASRLQIGLRGASALVQGRSCRVPRRQ